jgi:hypothetical protein
VVARGEDEVVREVVWYPSRRSSLKGATTSDPLLLPPSCFASIQVECWWIQDWKVQNMVDKVEGFVNRIEFILLIYRRVKNDESV